MLEMWIWELPEKLFEMLILAFDTMMQGFAADVWFRLYQIEYWSRF